MYKCETIKTEQQVAKYSQTVFLKSYFAMMQNNDVAMTPRVNAVFRLQ